MIQSSEETVPSLPTLSPSLKKAFYPFLEDSHVFIYRRQELLAVCTFFMDDGNVEERKEFGIVSLLPVLSLHRLTQAGT